MVARENEQTLNVWMAEALTKLGLAAKPEVAQSGGRRIDVEVRMRNVRVAVEFEHGQSRQKQREAIRDADARIKQGLVACAVAVCYPDGTTKESIPGASYCWQVRDKDSTEDGTWIWGGLEQLASVIRLAPAQIGDPDAAAAALSSSLDTAVHRMSDTQKRRLARALDLPAGKGAARWDRPAKRALLVVATAVMFHSRLDSHLEHSRPEYDNRIDGGNTTPFIGDWPPRWASLCADDPAPIMAFSDAWNLILALDYKPIFETARAALSACPPDPAFADAIRDTAKAALAVIQGNSAQRHDLLGRIFHTVLDTARYDGSFYTTTAAATLLATLAIDATMCDWDDTDAIARLRITDPACGTGTLLMAAAERIRELAPHTRDDGDAARALIEQVFSGYDVNLTATHMAATTLGLLSPTTRFRNMKIGRAFLGVDDEGDAYLGSLEFLDQKPKLLSWPNAAQAVTQVDSGEQIAQADPADLVIMNPPFTRDSLRHDQFSKVDERKMKAREKQLFSNKPVHLSGNSAPFVVLADFMRKMDGGRIAAILPLVTATNASALEIRKFIGSRYYVEYIVSSHDPERIYFSENTSIGEMLLVCRAWDARQGDKPDTQVVNLARNPANPADAISAAHNISEGNVQNHGLGTVQRVSATDIEAGDWGAVQFLSEYLRREFVAR